MKHLTQTEKEIARILEEQEERMNLYIDLGMDGRMVRNTTRWWVLEFMLIWYEFKLKIENWLDGIRKK
jgi:hypothetical protein